MIFFEFLGYIFFKFGEFSLTFTAAVSAVAQRSLSGRCVYKESGSPSWTLDQPGTVTVGSGRAAYASGPTLTDRRHDEQRGSPYDAKCNVAEIGAVNMGEIGAVRKRSR